MNEKPYKNIVSPDIASYRRYIIVGEYENLDSAKSNLDRDVSQWKQQHRSSSWYKLNFPFAFATIQEQL